jgi:uncharacterized OB-fold protein
MGERKIVPNVHDRETAGFFTAASEGRLVYRACLDCGRGLHPPTAHCPSCGSWNTDWKQARGSGRLYSWTTVTRQIHPDFPTPYTLAVVELDDAPEVRLMGHLDGEPELTAGQPMEVWFERLGDGSTLPQWKPA